MHPVGSSPLLGLFSPRIALTSLVACGKDISPGEEATASYDGPLHLAEGDGRHPRAGAAGDVVDCNAWGTGGAFHGDVYSEGATSEKPAQAVKTAYSEGLFLSLPQNLAVAAEAEDRVLYVSEVAGTVCGCTGGQEKGRRAAVALRRGWRSWLFVLAALLLLLGAVLIAMPIRSINRRKP